MELLHGANRELDDARDDTARREREMLIRHSAIAAAVIGS